MGPRGLGKTHLLLAVAQRARERLPDLTIRYCTSEKFVQEFIHSVKRGRMEVFRARFREVDVLILDDFQFLQGKEQTLEEFFWTLDSLHQRGRHVVLGCDRSPRDLAAVADRTRSRISAGLVTEIAAPSHDTRLAILAALNTKSPTALSDEVLGIVAEHITDNIRDLSSALRQLHAYASLTGLSVTPETAGRQLAPLSGRSSAPRTPEDIIAVCADVFETTVAEILDHNRRPLPSAARQVAMYLTRQDNRSPLLEDRRGVRPGTLHGALGPPPGGDAHLPRSALRRPGQRCARTCPQSMSACPQAPAAPGPPPHCIPYDGIQTRLSFSHHPPGYLRAVDCRHFPLPPTAIFN